jgi:uncharacterized protein (TIGR02118 family)
MISYFVRYRGRADDPAAFTAYYEKSHAAVLKQLPGIRSLILHTPQSWTDPCRINPGGSLLLAQMTFDDPHALDAALRSEARKLAREDFRRFPPFHGEVSHEAMMAKVIF